ncbi:MAG: CPBP family intramembrane metalloprotease, partial [Pedobacter sp.]|nr:CPBP family intramembrane metalloprotease [Chitinophagaceae bacterium]
KKISWQQIGLVIAIAFTGLFLSGALAEINELIPISKGLRIYFKKLEDNYAEEMMAMVQMKTFADYLVSLVLIALAPAIVEEVFFRGGVQQLFTNWFKKPWVAILVTSILFSAVHMSYFGFLPRAMLGAVLGLLFYYSKNIWTNILMHFLNNGIAVTQLYYMSTKGKLDKKALDAMDEHFPFWLGAIALVGMIICLYLFKRESDMTLKNNTIVDAANTFA